MEFVALMNHRALKRTKTSTAVVDFLLDEIFEGRLRSGDRIDLDEVAKALDVSRSPVREALLMLERDGIISIRHHRGAFVEPFDAESIMDDFEVMGMLSGVAVARMARKRDPQAIAELEELLAELRATPSDQIQRRTDVVQQLLRAEHRAGSSRRLRAELRSFTGFLPWAIFSAGDHASTVRAHSRVVRAIAAGDAERASRYRIEDFRAAGRSIVSELVRRGVLDGVSC